MRSAPDGWLAVAGLGVFGSGLAYIMYHDALHVLPASQLGVFLNLEPVVTMLLAAPILGEPLTIVVLFGGAMIIGGIYLVNRKAARAAAARKRAVSGSPVDAAPEPDAMHKESPRPCHEPVKIPCQIPANEPALRPLTVRTAGRSMFD